jgi:hypothetical protein
MNINTSQNTLIMTKLLSFLIALTILKTIVAQDILLSVKKGTVLIDQTNWQVSYPPKKITKSSTISSNGEAILLVRKGSKYAKIYCPCENLSYTQINQKINSQAIKSNSYSNVIFNKPLETELGVQKGSASRGGGQEDNFYINIEDSSVIYNPEFVIEWRSPSNLSYIDGPQLINSKDSSVRLLPSQTSIETVDLEPGWYTLKFKANTMIKEQNVVLNAVIPFYIPSNEEKEKINLNIEELKRSTIAFGEDIYEIYLTEFLTKNRILGY